MIVTDQRKEIITNLPFIFELCVPGEPGEYNSECENPYEGTRGSDNELFYPGKKDWNKKLRRIIKHLKKIYKLENLNTAPLPYKGNIEGTIPGSFNDC